LAATLAIAAAAFGCAESQVGSSLLYLTPYKVEDLDCAELKKRASAAAARVSQLDQLRNRANESAAGPVVNTVVYGPDYSKARWEQQVYEDLLSRKACDMPAPPTLPPPTVPPPAR